MININKWMLNFVFFIILFIGITPFINALPPQAEVSTPTPGFLTITYPKYEYYPFNKDLELHFHVYNSTGHKRNDTFADCNIHLYDINGEQTFAITLSAASIDEFDVDLNTTVLNRTGFWSYIVECNTTNERGFVSTGFTINNNGSNETPSPIFMVIILLPLILGFLLMQWADNMSEQHGILKILIYLTPIPLLFMSITLGTIIVGHYYSFTELINVLGDYTYIFGLIFFILVAYFIMYIIKKSIDIARQEDKEKLEY